MDVRLLAGMAVAGIAIGMLAVFGLLPGVFELIAWGALAAGGAIAALRRIPTDAFRHVAFGGVLAGFTSGDVKILQLRRYLENNPELKAFAEANGGIEAVSRTAVLTSELVTGALFGLIGGFLAWYFRRRFPTR